MSRLAIKKGDTNDELRRNKERARKTMKQLKNTKKVGENTSPEKNTRVGGGGGFTTTGGGATGITEDTPINLLLFSNMKKEALNNMMTASLGNTMNSNSNYMSVILPLKNIIKAC